MSDDRLILDTARRALAIEAATLAGLADVVDEAFCAVVRALRDAPGRVVVTGVGKSALVARKVAATLNSTGTPALFLHAADALHGDLGMVQPADLALALSRSGETAELRALAPLLRARARGLVAVVARGDSTLARVADHVLVTPVAREADAHDLAPTASALAQMAVGDALAVALAALRGFTRDDFARHHPGGALGKRLTLTLAELAAHNQRPHIPPGAPLDRVVTSMTGGRLGATVVVERDGEAHAGDAAGRVAGLITDGDLRRALARGTEVLRLAARDVMTPSPATLPPDALAADGLALLRRRGFNHVVLADAEGGAYRGLVHLHDFVRGGLA